MKEISKAIIKVMSEVEGIEKSLTVGAGRNSYKGVSDKDVRLKIGLAMRNSGLCILPIGIEAKTTVSRWEEESTWNGKTQMKTKQSVFTEVESKYMLLHTSGESIEVAGYGHGVDSQDKSAGKATTYALKNALLSIFLVPTGTIDDTDNTHSNDLPIPEAKPEPMITKVQETEIDKLVKSRGRTISEVCKIGKIKSLDVLTKVRADKLIKHLKGLPEATLQ